MSILKFHLNLDLNFAFYVAISKWLLNFDIKVPFSFSEFKGPLNNSMLKFLLTFDVNIPFKWQVESGFNNVDFKVPF